LKYKKIEQTEEKNFMSEKKMEKGKQNLEEGLTLICVLLLDFIQIPS